MRLAPDELWEASLDKGRRPPRYLSPDILPKFRIRLTPYYGDQKL